jgi:phosphoribosyl 1,2-cyclic phosphate phosphodiesterase
MQFYASHGTLRVAAKQLERDCHPGGLLSREAGELLNLEIHEVEALRPVTVGPYRVTPFTANHDPGVEPLLYAVQTRDCSLFYGTDTATLAEDVWQGLCRCRLQFDIVILDHTYGPGEQGSDHLSASQFVEHVVRMRQEGLLATGARVLATHIAHEGNPVHPELASFASRHGYEVAYDGMEVLGPMAGVQGSTCTPRT